MRPRIFRHGLIATAALALAAFSARASGIGTYTQLYAFTGGSDGYDANGVTTDAYGNVYGTTYNGGIRCGSGTSSCGTVFKLDPSGTLTNIVTFNGYDGIFPTSQLLVIGTTLYGTAGPLNVAPNICGVIFSVNTDGSNFTVLHYLDNSKGGCNPTGPLILAPGGKALYGITSQGGLGHGQGGGVLFQINVGGSYDVLHAFGSNKTSDGYKATTLLMDKSGTLYGTTLSGGTHNAGIVYQYVPKTKTYTVLYNFTGKLADESGPYLGSIGPTGILYGATRGGYPINQFGTLFSLTTGAGTSTYTRLYDFNQSGQYLSGYSPSAPLLLRTGALLSADSIGPLVYDTKLAHNGYVLPEGFGPFFFGSNYPFALTTDAVIGSSAGGGINNAACQPFGCGVIYRWALTN